MEGFGRGAILRLEASFSMFQMVLPALAPHLI